MDVHHHHEYKVNYFIGSLCFLSSIQIHNDTTDSVKSQHLQSSQKLKKLLFSTNSESGTVLKTSMTNRGWNK